FDLSEGAACGAPPMAASTPASRRAFSPPGSTAESAAQPFHFGPIQALGLVFGIVTLARLVFAFIDAAAAADPAFQADP
ncbi:hypothetical protein, partial [Achromobacter xylosoxidans]|uniref:hypothetical protein n=3 Tax=Alcaligenes xylosoxydans xylosoxydans TaxID=85698 RepID=UPI0039B6EF94